MIQTLLAIALTLGLQTANAAVIVVPPSHVQEKVRPILDLCRQAVATQGELQNTSFYEAASLAGKLFQDRTKSSDEALVVLMHYYIGEATGEDLLHHVTIRGKRMLPLLLKYRDAHIVFPKRKYPSSSFLSLAVRKENFDNAIRSVRAGKTIGDD